MFRLYRAYSDGFLPDTGSLTDQTNLYVEAMDEISLAKGVMDAEDQERNNSSNNDGG